MFTLIKKSKRSGSRIGELKTNHGTLRTPFFMPVATQGTIKHINALEMQNLGAQILLSNTYHLMLRPGEALIKKIGGLHKFMNWNRPILTDSGGFQVFSLSSDRTKTGKSLVDLYRDGVRFKSYVDGREFDLTPEKALQIQADMGVDIAVCLDECVALPAKIEYIKKSVELTTYWAGKTKDYHRKMKIKGKKPLLFAVVQGGLSKQQRIKSLQELASIGFDGYNIGGLSVGESARQMYGVLDYLVPLMPADKPRYLMGVGYPENIVNAVKRGVDMFDCVIPTREGRHGRLFYWRKGIKKKFTGLKNFYHTTNITNAQFAQDFTPINSDSKLPELRELTRGYLNHLFRVGEPLGQRLASLNNLEFYMDLMENIRAAIDNDDL